MTYYYMTTEAYEKKIIKDKEIIRKLNSGKLSIDEAEKQLEKLWSPKERKK